MPVLAIPLDELYGYLGASPAPEVLENELHRFGCSVEGWTTVRRWRCPRCTALSESGEGELPPPECEGCGADLRAADAPAQPAGDVRVLRMELLAVRPDLFDPAGLARALRGFLGLERGAPAYRVSHGEAWIDVDPALAGPEVHRPRIAAATVHGLQLDDARLRSLMKLQENVHWALGRDRKLASIGVYDLATVRGPGFRYRAAGRDELRFVPLGFDPRDPAAALTPGEILERHPKGRAFARLLATFARVPLLEDAAGNVLSMPPIINSEATRVTAGTRDVLVDVTGLEDRHIDRALNIVVTSLLASCPGSSAASVEVRYADGARRTPDLRPQQVLVDPAEASRIIGVRWSADDLVELLGRMRHDAVREEGQARVFVPAWRADIMHPRDLIEDAAIAHGYDRIAVAELASPTFGRPHPREELAARARAALTGLGCLEVLTLALTSETESYEACGMPAENREVRIENPISVEQTMLRVSVVPGLLATLAVNLGHPYPQRIFEAGLVTFADGAAETGAAERLVGGIALAGDGVGYADIRAALDTLLRELDLAPERVEFRRSAMPLFLPGRGAELWIGGARAGILGEVHPDVLGRHRIVHPAALAEVDLERVAAG
ncbi:MAG: phenylalanine--tRNA ligase subunit beta [Acidobacteria bacterium]|nr:phenylalanine--tRNA ligase subunit beta [Acidobacteriota bacterium]